MNTKALKIVEVMIIVMIIGLLAVMAVPAFQKIKVSDIAKRAYYGQIVTDTEKIYMLEHINMVPPQYLLPNPASTIYTAPVESFQTIVINGKTYKLVPQ